MKSHKEATKAAKLLREYISENPDMAYRMLRAGQQFFNVHAIEKTFMIPGGSLYTAKDKPGQTSYKHSDKLATMFGLMLEGLEEAGKIEAKAEAA